METSLYDKTGRAKVYIAVDDSIIYTWGGHAVAYIDDERLYGWKGKHLGWYIDGILYDL